MSEFERSRSSAPPFVPAAHPESFVADDAAADAFDDPGLFQREGLPPGFRMRHDRHYVDQLTNRSATPHVRLVPIGDIDVPGPPDARDIGALTRSIGTHGVLQPLLVRPRAGRFELVAGTRRLQAAAAAGLHEVPCLVHQVDDLRAQALADALDVRAIEPPAPPLASATTTGQPGVGLIELSRSLDAIGSCLHLLGERDAQLRDRVALDLVRTEAHRAGRLVRCLTLLTQEPALVTAPVSLGEVFAQVADAYGPERRLSGASLEIDAAAVGLGVRADRDWLGVGLSGALGGMLALVEGTTSPAVRVRLARTASGSSVMVEIEQRTASLPSWAVGRLFDPEWTDRPGGYQSAIELAAARRVVELHGGGAEAVTGERGGCRIVLVLPAA